MVATLSFITVQTKVYDRRDIFSDIIIRSYDEV